MQPRVKVEISAALSSSGELVKAWVVVPEHAKVVADFAHYIQATFALSDSCPHGIALGIDGYSIPSAQSASILRENDTIIVERRAAPELDSIVTKKRKKSVPHDEAQFASPDVKKRTDLMSTTSASPAPSKQISLQTTPQPSTPVEGKKEQKKKDTPKQKDRSQTSNKGPEIIQQTQPSLTPIKSSFAPEVKAKTPDRQENKPSKQSQSPADRMDDGDSDDSSSNSDSDDQEPQTMSSKAGAETPTSTQKLTKRQKRNLSKKRKKSSGNLSVDTIDAIVDFSAVENKSTSSITKEQQPIQDTPTQSGLLKKDKDKKQDKSETPKQTLKQTPKQTPKQPPKQPPKQEDQQPMTPAHTLPVLQNSHQSSHIRFSGESNTPLPVHESVAQDTTWNQQRGSNYSTSKAMNPPKKHQNYIGGPEDEVENISFFFGPSPRNYESYPALNGHPMV
eukprot:TRINITY_DN2304_c0_g1_i3.p1 TRINITY_DN2304_c0_g1~~TRINITY_DN2304_c0_g1_i3.p1  ORF type:complete len:448 (+),score=126.31 TRINITY_DN2304_c0_g1_i3:53-1396(+)